MKKIAILIDGGHLRNAAQRARYTYNPEFIERVALACAETDEDILRILYYDCPPYTGSQKKPVSGSTEDFNKSGQWLNELATKDRFAVRLGVLKFRGYQLKNTPIEPKTLTDNDFKPRFEQKGVDMRIGLDIAAFSEQRSVDRIMLITNDTDTIPAMKHGRKAGLQIVLARVPNQRPAQELLHHVDFLRDVPWPSQSPLAPDSPPPDP